MSLISTAHADLWLTATKDSCHCSLLFDVIAMSSSSASSTSEGGDQFHWEVLDILAQRTTPQGDAEFLVMWKPSWVLKSQLAKGPVVDQWKQTPLRAQAVRLRASDVPIDSTPKSASDTQGKRQR
jgi:hypothetical protein